MEQHETANYFEMEMKVRDYECDLQGIVNNANYQHYYEHTRHEFLTEHGVSFARLHADGLDFVVARIEMAFKSPLHSGDRFLSVLQLDRESVKYVFRQRIYRLPERTLCNVARVDCVAVEHGSLVRHSCIDTIFFGNEQNQTK